jgi:hypothetical protein
MPLTAASKRSGGGVEQGVGQQTARPAAIPRSGSASSNGSGINRARPVPLRRDTTAIRPKLASQGSSSASTSQSAQSAASVLHSIPRPSFPPSDAFDKVALDETLIHARLLQLARYYLQQSDQSDKLATYDLHSASLYARLALQTDPTPRYHAFARSSTISIWTKHSSFVASLFDFSEHHTSLFCDHLRCSCRH